MKFQIKYVKKAKDIHSFGESILDTVEFKNLSALKRWYKTQFDKGLVEHPFFDGYCYTTNKSFSYYMNSRMPKYGVGPNHSLYNEVLKKESVDNSQVNVNN